MAENMELKRIGIHQSKKHGFPVKQEFVDKVRAVAPGAAIYVGTIEEIAAQTDDLDVIVAMPDAFEGASLDFLMRCPNLKWIQSWLSGVDAIMASDAIKIEGVRVSAVRGAHASAISHHVIGFIYYYLRCFPQLFEARNKRDWHLGKAAPLDEALSKTVGLVGLGNIGMEIARKCHILGFRVLAIKRSPVESEFVEHCYQIDQLDSFLAQCDYVVVICPLTPESRGMFGKHQFEVMKKDAVIINVARGAIIKEDELIDALDCGEIAGAALDAFCDEPLLPDSPFWEHEKVILSFHQAATSPLTKDRVNDVILDNLTRYQEGRPLLFEEVLK